MDMERIEWLDTVRDLLSLSPDAVLVLLGDRVIFSNDAADKLFGVSGRARETFAAQIAALPGGDSFVTSAAVGGRTGTVTAARHGKLLMLTVRMPDAPVVSVPETSLARMREAAFRLRMAMDRLLDGADIESPAAAALRHSYHSILHLCEQLSDSAALEKGTLPFSPAVLDLEKLTRDLTESVAHFVRDRKVRVSFEGTGGVCSVRGDRDRLQQLLLILLSNSLLHTPEGGAIRVRLQREGRRWVITLDDTGEGLDGEALARVFTPREPSLTPEGAGLGLRIARDLAALHGGALLLESRKDAGARAVLTLPVSERLPLADAARPAAPQGPGQILTELCDVLGSEAYTLKYTD